MAKAKKVEVLPVAIPTHPDLVPTEADGQTIGSFLSNLIPFFREAQSLESQAKSHAALVLAIKAPKHSDDDEALQVAIRACSVVKKSITAHWTITTLVHAFHRRLVAARDRGVKLLDEASDHGNRLHNAYVAEQREIARKEQERIHREIDAEAERKAVAAEEASAELSEREREFVKLFSGPYRLGPVSAAEAAGYANPVTASGRLMKSEKVQAALAAAQDVEIARAAEAPKVVANVTQASGAHDRTTRSAELFDEAALCKAILDGRVTAFDLLQINRVKLNEAARSLGPLINKWPGVRLVEKTRVV